MERSSRRPRTASPSRENLGPLRGLSADLTSELDSPRGPLPLPPPDHRGTNESRYQGELDGLVEAFGTGIVREPVETERGWVAAWHPVIEGEAWEDRIQGKTAWGTREQALADLREKDAAVTRRIYQACPELQAAEAEATTARLERVLAGVRAGSFGRPSEPGFRFQTRMADLVDAARSPESRHSTPQAWTYNDQETAEIIQAFSEDPDPMVRRVLILALADQAREHGEGEAVVPPAAWMRALHRLSQGTYQSELGDLARAALRTWDLRTERLDDLVAVEPIFETLGLYRNDDRAPERTACREEGLDKWENLVLAEWAKGKGFTDPAGAFGMEDRVGHFDFGSWSLHSQLGEAHATPFSTDYGGRTYLVEWDERQKAAVLMTRLRRELEVCFAEGRSAGRLGAEEQLAFLKLRGDLERVHEGFLEASEDRGQALRMLETVETALGALAHLEEGLRREDAVLPEPVRDIVRCALGFKPCLEHRQEAIRATRSRRLATA